MKCFKEFVCYIHLNFIDYVCYFEFVCYIFGIFKSALIENFDNKK